MGIQPSISRALSIEGWMFPQELEWLAKQASKSSVILEFGCHLGKSTRALADNTNGIVYAIDPWNNEYYGQNGGRIELGDDAYIRFCNNLADHIASGKVNVVKDFSYNAIIPKADFIFIDGNHFYSEVKKDIQIALNHLIPCGTIAGHDYGDINWPGVKLAVDEHFKNIEVIGTIWIYTHGYPPY